MEQLAAEQPTEPPASSVARTASQIIDADIATLEAENAAFEARLNLDSRASYKAAGEPAAAEPVARTASQIIDADIATLEAENAAFEARLNLDSRASYKAAARIESLRR